MKNNISTESVWQTIPKNMIDELDELQKPTKNKKTKHNFQKRKKRRHNERDRKEKPIKRDEVEMKNP